MRIQLIPKLNFGVKFTEKANFAIKSGRTKIVSDKNTAYGHLFPFDKKIEEFDKNLADLKKIAPEYTIDYVDWNEQPKGKKYVLKKGNKIKLILSEITPLYGAFEKLPPIEPQELKNFADRIQDFIKTEK